MNPKQREQLRNLSAQLVAKERKELTRRAAEARIVAQKDPKHPRAKWCVDRWSLQFLEEKNGNINLRSGIVVSVAKARATVRADGEDILCELPRELIERQQTALAPGDLVHFETFGDSWRIHNVQPRRSELVRQDPHFKERERAIVANIDIAAVVVSVVSPPLHPRLIDRYLAAIHKGGAQAIIVVNKTDLHESQEDLREDLEQLSPYREMGVPVFAVSTANGTGIDAVRAHLHEKTTVFVGHSGVGKSSLLNAVAEDAIALAGSIADVGKGRHTTTRSELVEIGDIRIIDTPGVREFAVEFKSASDVASCFLEFQQAGRCKFADCLHLDEPGCNVRELVRTGAISKSRFESYRRLLGPFVQSDDEEDEPPDERRGSFTCKNCGATVSQFGGGTEHRNHCPRCLHSVHLDDVPGDRLACCGGVMEPIAVWVRRGGEWAIVHRCRVCGHLSSNRIASDDNEVVLLSLAVQPISRPAFPLDRLTAPIR